MWKRLIRRISEPEMGVDDADKAEGNQQSSKRRPKSVSYLQPEIGSDSGGPGMDVGIEDEEESVEDESR